MFYPRAEPLNLAPGELHGLRLSLNTPVIAADELPTGPASAALVVHLEANGRPGVTLAVRSVRGGDLAFFSYRGDLATDDRVERAVGEAISFAESMGFQLSEKPLTNAGASASALLASWTEFVGSAETVPPRRGTEDLELELLDDSLEGMTGPGPELELDDPGRPASPVGAAEITQPLSDAAAAPGAAEITAPDAGGMPGITQPLPEPPDPLSDSEGSTLAESLLEVDPENTGPLPTGGLGTPDVVDPEPDPSEISLSKFREPVTDGDPREPVTDGDPADSGPGTEAAPKGAPLGRVKLVKRRRPRAAGASDSDPLLRLLSSF